MTENCDYPNCNKSGNVYYDGNICVCKEHRELFLFIDAALSSKTRYAMSKSELFKNE